MKKMAFIILVLCCIACKNNDAWKSESMPLEVSTDYESEFDDIAIPTEGISTEKFMELIDLVKLKQLHPEFQSDINEQLLNYTKDSLPIFNYPKGFSISDIKKTDHVHSVNDSTEISILSFSVTSNNQTFKDSVKVSITTRQDYLQDLEAVSIKTIKFLPFSKE